MLFFPDVSGTASSSSFLNADPWVSLWVMDRTFDFGAWPGQSHKWVQTERWCTTKRQKDPARNKPCRSNFYHSSCPPWKPEGVSQQGPSKQTPLGETKPHQLELWWTDCDSQTPQVWTLRRWDGNRVWGHGGHGSKGVWPGVTDKLHQPRGFLCYFQASQPPPRSPVGPVWQGDMVPPTLSSFVLHLSLWHSSLHATDIFFECQLCANWSRQWGKMSKVLAWPWGTQNFHLLRDAGKHDFIGSQSRFHGTWKLGNKRD